MQITTAKQTAVLIGNPNVGKSLIFTHLTGKYVRVANYPGTTVDLSCGSAIFNPSGITIYDTPGINSLFVTSEDEQIVRDLLLDTTPDLVIQVADAKNLKRALFITSQLAELNLPCVLILNMWDEATEARLSIDTQKLSQLIGIPCIPTVAITKKGIWDIPQALKLAAVPKIDMKFDNLLETQLKNIISVLDVIPNERIVGLMLLSGDNTLLEYMKEKMSLEKHLLLKTRISEAKSRCPYEPGYIINQARHKFVDSIHSKVVKKENILKSRFLDVLGKATMHPILGIFFLAAVLVFMWYFVGILAAGDAVGFLEEVVFAEYVNKALTFFVSLVPIDLLQRFLVGEYGIYTMGFTYAFAIIFPVILAFFLCFGFLEDSGYVPRLAVMSNKACGLIGLNGKAVLPLVLGLGCDTMATMTTRVLESKRERTIVTLLLSLTIPCSAKLGVIMALAGSPLGTIGLVWFITVLLTILIVGFISSRIIPGKKSDFVQEVPPIRIPSIKNIIIKTFTRLKWYLNEAVPLFLIGTAALFVLAEIGVLAVINDAATPVVTGLLGLPKEATPCLIMGFLRRDFGAAGFFVLHQQNALTGNQILISLVVITFLIPCIAQVLVTAKERGPKTATLIVTFSLLYSLALGTAFNFFFKLTGIQL